MSEIYSILRKFNIDFEAFNQQIMKDGVIEAKTKRLIAIASAVATGCDFCVEHHVKLACSEGISKEEIAEAILVASLVRFGSGIRHLAKLGGDYEDPRVW